MKRKIAELINISADVFDDNILKNLINSNPESDFCDWSEEEKPSISIKTLGGYIEECLKQEYDDPYYLGAGYDKEQVYYEDRFPGVEVIETLELLEDHLSGTPFEIIEKIEEHIENEYWAPRYLYGPSDHDILLDSWADFVTIIKHKVRFMFFDKKVPKPKPTYDNYSNPYQILDEIGKSINEIKLLSRFKTGELEIHRARQHSPLELVDSVARIGPPPASNSQANRMSPAGISMFYGAFDSTTAVTEIIDIGKSSNIITIGQFHNLSELTLIDFSKLKYISIFDKERARLRDRYFFLTDFIRDLSSPISNDGSHHIEYVPTQVVTEYFKHVFKSDSEMEIHGMIYPSAKVKSGKCIVLFFNQEHVTEDLESTDKFLALKKSSLRDVKVGDVRVNIKLP